ncbi:MAG TPA: hypothetical protein PK511_10155 [Chitinophagales bacterium]|nr:hypothetical protein [Chitinophagales bacterium]HMX03346.1 hypothetical protein [Chitinophagales bacterium]HMZ89412.1 hypothetical protein [Chitinophagales bacterium]HNA57533.1 hypothetical protein [Chitinophagales bacterium]HNE46154.1 hypothetical protein [Chitinophagales bacterium]
MGDSFALIVLNLLLLSTISKGQWVKIAEVPHSSLDIQFLDINTGFIIGDQFVFKTADGGYTGDSTELGNSLDLLLEFDFIDADYRIYCR